MDSTDALSRFRYRERRFNKMCGPDDRHDMQDVKIMSRLMSRFDLKSAPTVIRDVGHLPSNSGLARAICPRVMGKHSTWAFKKTHYWIPKIQDG